MAWGFQGSGFGGLVFAVLIRVHLMVLGTSDLPKSPLKGLEPAACVFGGAEMSPPDLHCNSLSPKAVKSGSPQPENLKTMQPHEGRSHYHLPRTASRSLGHHSGVIAASGSWFGVGFRVLDSGPFFTA